MIRVKFGINYHKEAHASWRRAYCKYPAGVVSGLSYSEDGYRYTIELPSIH